MKNKLIGFIITLSIGIPIIVLCAYNDINLGWWAALLGFTLSSAVDHFMNRYLNAKK